MICEDFMGIQPSSQNTSMKGAGGFNFEWQNLKHDKVIDFLKAFSGSFQVVFPVCLTKVIPNHFVLFLIYPAVQI